MSAVRRSARVHALHNSTGVHGNRFLTNKARRTDTTVATTNAKPKESKGEAKTTLTIPDATEVPRKRRKTSKNDSESAPITPTPPAISLTTEHTPITYSTGDIDDATPPPTDRPVEPHKTNAPLRTPAGSTVLPTAPNIDDPASKPANGTTNAAVTTATLLDEACAHLLRVDPTLQKVIERHSCRVFSPEGLAEEIDPFRNLASGIMAQQVSGAAATSIKNKFVALFPPAACPNGFPPPALVAATPLATLRAAGLSQRKAEYIQGLASKFDTGELSAEMLVGASDEEVLEKLTAVRGLGRWSVEMFSLFGLKRTDVFSTGDLGVQRGMAAHMGRDVKKLKAKGGGKWKYMSEKDMLEHSAKFAPYRSLFMWYMWRVEDVDVSAIQDA
ncbi:3-methyladenine DNA glycosylase [Elasticomyces elasticus]|nr:3-methyladenine DNA glycosylase [Elasticomyces elasticus]